MVSFLVITVLNCNRLKSTLPHSAPQLFVNFGEARQPLSRGTGQGEAHIKYLKILSCLKSVTDPLTDGMID